MAKFGRIWIPALGVGIALAGVGWFGLLRTSAVVASAPTIAHSATPGSEGARPQDEVDSDLKAFLDGLQRLRENDESVLRALHALAETLCERDARCDTLAVLAHYAALSPEERTHGLDEDRRLGELWNEVQAARRANLSEDDWQRVREPILDELTAMVRRNEKRADPIPAARAASLSARLAIEQTDGDRDDSRVVELLSSAERDARTALAIFERIGQLRPKLEPLWILARIQAALGDTPKARASFDECERLARRLSTDAFREHAIEGLIRLAKEAGDLDEVQHLLQELARFRTPSTSWLLTKNQANLLLQRDHPVEATRFVERFPPSDPYERREWNVLLGSAAVRAGDLATARRMYSADAKAPWKGDVKLAMASLSLSEGNFDAVVEELDDATALADLTGMQPARAQHLMGAAWIGLGQYEKSIAPLTIALDNGSRLQARLRDDRSGANAIGENVGLHTVALLARAQAELGRDLDAARTIETYQSLSLRNALAEDSSATLDESSMLERRQLTDDDLRAWAAHFECGLVTWVVGADSTVVARVTRAGRASAASIDLGRRAIDAAVRRLREAVIAGDDAYRARLADEIVRTLLPDEIRSTIADTDGGRLLFLLHGPLERLPVELFEADSPLAAGGIVPVVLPGLPERAPGAEFEASDLEHWSLLGSPVDVAGTRILPGASEELAAVAELRPGADLAVDTSFDRAAIEAALRGHAALHVATHLTSAFGPRERRLADVGLELSRGGAISAREIAAIRPRLPLAVLSACETGDGGFVDSLPLRGLACAFLESGTRNLLVTLWPVEDQAARAFAVAYHRALRGGGPPSRAAAAARLALRQQGFRATDWAAFRALGRD